MSERRVDIVIGPVRYPIVPFLALIGILLVPVVALVALLVWSDGQADEHDAALASTPQESGPTVFAGTIGPQLTTPVMSYRRAPAQVATAGDDLRLADTMAELAFFVDGRSCLSVSVDGRPVTSHNPDVGVIPASTHKLLVASVAIEVLGADHVFTTDVVGPAAVGGVVDGDVFLVGGGDPLLVSSDVPPEDAAEAEFNTTSLDALADSVVAAGVTSITGSVVGDGSRYDDEFVIASWGPGVAKVDAGPYDALVANDARVLGRTGRQNDPNDAAAREFVRLLRDRGVVVSGGAATGQATAGLATIASIDSQPLSAAITEMLTTSDNDTAEMLLKELGVADVGQGTVAAGLNVVDRTLRSWGVPMDGVRLVDASGLSNDNRVTCPTLLAVLQHIEGGPLEAGLPVAGRTGTLADEFVGTAVDGRLTAKTGTLGNPPVDVDPPAVKGLAGYLLAPNGATIEFVMVLNGADISNPDKYESYWSALAERLAAYPGGPAPATLGPR